MMSPDDCLKAAWNALLRGDLAERDRMCDLAKNLMNAGERVRSGGPIIEGEAIRVGEAIALPDLSAESVN
jgi:hypothetical protein